MKSIRIENDCWLGYEVRVLDNIMIGKGCVIRAGAAVTKSILPYSIAAGVLAKVIGLRGESTAHLVLSK